MIEKDIENKIKRFLKEQDLYFIKVHGGMYQTPGVPDLIINYQGIFIGLEVKKWPNKPTEIQKYHLLKIRKSLGVSLIIDELNLEEFKNLILRKVSYEELISFSNKCFKIFGV